MFTVAEPFRLDTAGLTASEMVFRRLLHAVTHGEIAPGEVETEERLATHFHVSRTPLRDAIRRLELLDLLVREPGRGLKVPPMSMREMRDLSATREALEGLLAASAARAVAAGTADLARLRGIHARHSRLLRLDDPELALAVGYDLHEEIRRLAGNRSAALCHERVLLAFERYRRLARELAARPEQIITEHDTILAAIAAGDATAAEAAMRRHIAAGREGYAAVLAAQLD